jgi:hypothetical protein
LPSAEKGETTHWVTRKLRTPLGKWLHHSPQLRRSWKYNLDPTNNVLISTEMTTGSLHVHLPLPSSTGHFYLQPSTTIQELPQSSYQNSHRAATPCHVSPINLFEDQSMTRRGRHTHLNPAPGERSGFSVFPRAMDRRPPQNFGIQGQFWWSHHLTHCLDNHKPNGEIMIKLYWL